MGWTDFARMALMPKFRPLGSDRSAQQDDPEQGVASIGGTSGGVIDLPFSVTHSLSRQIHKEVRRVYDRVRHYYVRQDGTIDWGSHIDTEVARKIKFSDGSSDDYGPSEINESEELIDEGQTRDYGPKGEIN